MERVLAVVAAVALVAAACGTGTTPSSTDPATTGSLGTAPPVPPQTLAASVSRAEPDPAAPVDRLVAGFNDAGFALLDRQDTENLVFSPLSIGHALLMARGAADDPTGGAIDDLFDLPAGRSAHEAWNAVDQAIASASRAREDIVVTIADRIWPRIGLQPDQEWIDLLAAEHGASVETPTSCRRASSIPGR